VGFCLDLALSVPKFTMSSKKTVGWTRKYAAAWCFLFISSRLHPHSRPFVPFQPRHLWDHLILVFCLQNLRAQKSAGKPTRGGSCTVFQLHHSNEEIMEIKPVSPVLERVSTHQHLRYCMLDLLLRQIQTASTKTEIFVVLLSSFCKDLSPITKELYAIETFDSLVA